jgi:DNA-binding phage protein
MARLTKDYRESLLQDLCDPHEAAAYLNAALEEGDCAVFFMALQDVADAKGIPMLTTTTQLPAHPQLDAVSAVLSALDLRLTVTTK